MVSLTRSINTDWAEPVKRLRPFSISAIIKPRFPESNLMMKTGTTVQPERGRPPELNRFNLGSRYGQSKVSNRLTAPAHSPPIRSSIAKSFRSLIPRISASCCLGPSSGRMPAKKGRARFPEKGSACSGNERDRGIASSRVNQSFVYWNESNPLSSCLRTPAGSLCR